MQQEKIFTNHISDMGLVVNNPPANGGDIRDLGLIPGLGRSPGGGQSTPIFLRGEPYGQRSQEGYSS